MKQIELRGISDDFRLNTQQHSSNTHSPMKESIDLLLESAHSSGSNAYSSIHRTVQLLAPLALLANEPINENHTAYTESPRTEAKLWTFLHDCTVAQLRRLCLTHKCQRQSRKSRMIKMLFIALKSTRLQANSDAFYEASIHVFYDWLGKQSTRNMWKYVSEDILEQNQTGRRPTFSLSELSRLIGVLVYSERARSAFLAKERALSRVELDARTNRQIFWQTIVSTEFHNKDFVCPIDFTGVLDGIAPNIVP